MTTDAGRAFHALLDTLRDADQTFLTGPRADMDALGIAEGYRHLTHLLGYAFDLYLEADAERPVFTPLASPTQKMLGDNVDSLYHFAPLRGDRRYRIRGTRGNEVYLAFCVYGGKPDGEWSERVVANLSQRDIACGADGTFEIVLAADPTPETTSITLAPDAVCVIVRQYFVDRANLRPAQFTIEARDSVPAPAPLDDATLARRLGAVATFVRETIQFAPLPSGLPPNLLGPAMPWNPNVPGWGTPDNVYALGLFRLEPDEALVIEGRSPPCVYFGAQLWNRYMQSLDYRYHRVSLNHGEIAFEPDGSFRLVVAPRDPGMPNWLDTAGHREGVVFCRWLQSEALPDQPTSRLIKLDRP
ncbi:MAG: hypothetical protein ABIR79_06870 [Candidatus Binatia bacterium]